jgi:hypothetical protein
MKPLPRVLSLAPLVCASVAQAASDASATKPIAVWIQTDPWAMVLGADTPRVAVYGDGEVVFVKKVGKALEYHHVHLEAAALAELRRRIEPVLALSNLRGYYDLAPNVTDLPKAKLYVSDGRSAAATEIYGLMAKGTELPAFTRFGGAPKPDTVPEAVLALHRWCAAFDDAKSTPWVAPRIEVMLWDYPAARDVALDWPRSWPSIHSDRAVQRGENWSVFFDGSQVDEVRERLDDAIPRGAIELEGRRYAASYRFAFPGADLWEQAFIQAFRKEAERGGS